MSRKPLFEPEPQSRRPAHEVILQKLQELHKKYEEMDNDRIRKAKQLEGRPPFRGSWQESQERHDYREHRRERLSMGLRRFYRQVWREIETLSAIHIPEDARTKVIEELRKLPAPFFTSSKEEIFRKIME